MGRKIIPKFMNNFSYTGHFINLIIFSSQIPFTLLVQDLRCAIKGLVGLFLTAFLVLLFTPLGFPYSGDLSSPAPQRYIISVRKTVLPFNLYREYEIHVLFGRLLQHIDRTWYDVNGNTRLNDSGLWIVNMDVNSPRMVSSLIPEIAKAELVKQECEQELYCGLPYLLPVMTIMWYVSI